MWHAARPIYWHWIVVKENTAFISGPSKENEQHILKDPIPLAEGFNDSVRERAAECLIGLYTVLWLVVDEVIGWCFRNLSHQPSGSNSYWIYVLVAVFVQLLSRPALLLDCSPSVSSVHGILQAKILELNKKSGHFLLQGIFRPRNRTCVSCIGRWIIHLWKPLHISS